jgi:hypothetical protein
MAAKYPIALRLIHVLMGRGLEPSPKGEAEEIAARTVNKERARSGESKGARR